jgi:glucose/arabinose dehydrogenase
MTPAQSTLDEEREPLPDSPIALRGRAKRLRSFSIHRHLMAALIVLALAALVRSPAARAAALPAGFSETVVASGLANPTAMEFAPDGRFFVCEQAGELRVIKNGALLATPFVTLTVDSSGERGLLGVTFDPDFATNNFVYVYYTATSPTVHNRISRFTASGDVAVAGSEVVILDLTPLSSATNHNGGAIHFGEDGKLYAAVGDNANGANAQTLGNLLGKILRINADGSVPGDNPFVGQAAGVNRAIWALGLRNPYTFSIEPVSGRMFINDVGENTWEEIDAGISGSNYGWPDTEGPTSDTRYRAPVYAYQHQAGTPTGCAITGGAFYNPQGVFQFPGDYDGDYFFADYCTGWIYRLETASFTAGQFATGISSPVDLKVSDEGALYYLARGDGSTTGVVAKIDYANAPPSITSQPSNRTVAVGQSATFAVDVAGAAPLSYRWQRNGANIAGAISSSYTLASAQAPDNGARFRVVVTNALGTVTSNEAMLTVTLNTAPVATITQPVVSMLYSGGQTINFAGTATDAEDGTLLASAFTWEVVFHHDTHTHPFIQPTSGITSGSFVISPTGEMSANVWYRIHLVVRDSAGLTHATFRDIRPRTAQVTVATSPAGLQVKIDGQPATTPTTFTSVVGMQRTLEAVAPQASGGATYVFQSWSDGGAALHTISTLSSQTTYTAAFVPIQVGTGDGLSAVYYDNRDFTGATVSRVDPTVNFDWGTGAPAPGIGPDTFSARWTGQVQAQVSQTYTFYTTSDDGVRLRVDGQLIIDNWTNHAAAENSGTIALTAGQRYNIEMEFYEDGGLATAKLSWSGPSTPKQIIPQSQLYAGAPTAFAVKINFQPTNSPVPPGYLKDDGAAYAARGNGYTYGWNETIPHTRERNGVNSPDRRYDTLNHMQKPENPNAVWEIAVPSGTYTVRIVSGDPYYIDSVYRVAAEDVLIISGTPTPSTHWIDDTRTITVTDGRLTITNAAGAYNNKLCFIEITGQ